MFLRNHMIIITFIINKQTNKRNIQKITDENTERWTEIYTQNTLPIAGTGLGHCGTIIVVQGAASVKI